MIKIISKVGVVPGILAASVCFAVSSESPVSGFSDRASFIVGTDSAQRTGERLMILAADDSREKAEKERQKKVEELKKKQKAEHDAREELRKKQMAEHAAREQQRRKEMAERQAKEAERRKEAQRGRDEHRGGDGDRSRTAGNTPGAPTPMMATPKPLTSAPQQAVPSAASGQGAAPQQAAPAVSPAVAPIVAPQKATPAPLATAPTSPLVVRTYPASGVGFTSTFSYATLNGYASYPSKTVRVWFEWGDSPSFGQGATQAQSFTGEKSLGQQANFPIRKKNVYFRAVAESSGLLVYGETRSFVAP